MLLNTQAPATATAAKPPFLMPTFFLSTHNFLKKMPAETMELQTA
jgi:hypothetical protein